MATTRRASTVWDGSLKEGSGQVTFQSSGLGTYPVSWPARAEEPNGVTSPEELIAAAHASCFSMALSKALADNGTPAEKLETTASVGFKPGVGITGSHLLVSAKVAGLSDEDFQRLAVAAKEGCPVSKALAGVDITIEASLA